MDRLRVAGTALAAVALAGYGLGVAVAYPGRAFTVTLLMVGVTIAVVGGNR